MIEIFWGRGSPYSWRVQLALEITGIPYRSRQLHFAGEDLKSDEFLAINPRGQVPALRDGGFTLYESIAILAYLDAIRPEPALFGNAPEERGLIWRLIMECVYYLEPHMTAFAGTIISGELPEKTDEAIASRRQVEQELDRLEVLLERNDYLAGNRLSAADVAVYPVVQLLLIAARRENTEAVSGRLCRADAHFPALKAWCRRIEALPGFERTNPPHWRV
ncbi:glutathione S-transferase family protein [Methylomicrobium agile]|uniref:glutathione S-transferase family protein n=1 Tax=Methylomicrobium agile TaxID=39774 RepID=UPI0004DF3B2E|nr:glutathione S-transferase family protein [Methylomicrobium agile]